MPLRFAAEVPDAPVLVRNGLNQLSARRNPLSERVSDFTALQIGTPHDVYDLRADDVAGGRGLSSARRTGVRYLIQAADGPVAAAEVHADSSGQATLLANINYGRFAEATSRALGQLANYAQVRDTSYEVRLLRFSAIPLLAMWLKPDAGGADIIYPLAPTPGALEAERPYSEEEFLAAITPLAVQRAANQGQQPTVP